MRPDYQRTAVAKYRCESLEAVALQLVVEIHEDEIPAEDEVERSAGRIIPNVVLKKHDAVAIALFQAVRFQLAVDYVEGGVDELVGEFLQRTALVAPRLGSIEHVRIHIRRQNLQALSTAFRDIGSRRRGHEVLPADG